MSIGLCTASLNMPRSSMLWCVVTPTRLNIASCTWLWKMSPLLNFVGGIHLIGWRGNTWRMSCACASSSRKLFSMPGSISYAWPSPICSSFTPACFANASLTNWLARTVCAFSTASAVVR